MLDVRRLALLRELHLRGTIAAVAAALHQTPSAVSQQLAQLEREAGVPLLLRAGRRLQLTPHAELLVEHAADILERLERAEAELAARSSTAAGTLRVAIFQSVALALLPRALDVLEREHPDLTAIVTQREPETALHETFARDFDLVIAEEYPGHAAPHLPGLDRQPLTTDAIRLASPPAGSRWQARTIADAATAPWVMEPHGAASRHWAEQACRRAGFEPQVRFETADLQAHMRLIETGHAVALLPDLIWQGARPSSVTLAPLEGDPRRTVFTSTRSTIAARPSVLAMRAALETAAAELRTTAAE